MESARGGGRRSTGKPTIMPFTDGEPSRSAPQNDQSNSFSRVIGRCAANPHCCSRAAPTMNRQAQRSVSNICGANRAGRAKRSYERKFWPTENLQRQRV